MQDKSRFEISERNTKIEMEIQSAFWQEAGRILIDQLDSKVQEAIDGVHQNVQNIFSAFEYHEENIDALRKAVIAQTRSEIKRILLEFSLIELKKQYEDLLEKANDMDQRLNEAMYDGLTRLYRRKYALERFKNTYSALKREAFSNYKPEVISVILFDADNFKNVNDKHGHDAGDEVLKEIGDILNNSGIIQRSEDIKCRYGGEEFLIILPKCKLEDAEKIAEKLRERIKNTPIYIGDNGDVKILNVTISAGVSSLVLHPEGNKNPEKHIHAAISVADDLMYESKKGGRNLVTVQKFTDKEMVEEGVIL